MPKVPYMTSDSEKRLLDTLELVTDDDSADPNEALAKAASETSLPAGHVPILVNAYNTGRTIVQRQMGKDAWERAKPFPIADAAVILDKMFPNGPPKPAEKVSNDYDLPPGGWVSRKLLAEKVAAARQVDLKMVDKPVPPYPKDETKAIRRMDADLVRQKQAVDEARRRASVAYDLVNEETANLVEYFKTAGSKPFEEVKFNCEAIYGDVVKPLFNMVEGRLPHQLEKAAGRKIGAATGKPYDVVARCLDAANAFFALRDDWRTKESSLPPPSDLGKPRSLVDPILGIPIPPRKTPAAGGTNKQAASILLPAAARELAALPVAHMMTAPGRYMSSVVEEAAKAQAKKLLESKPDVGLASDLSTIQRESMLNELMSEDEVISGHPPDKVLSAYRELVELAPRSSRKRAIMRDFIRRRLEGGAHSYFDLEGLTRLEKNLRQVEEGVNFPGES